jgi:hypothetical protein
MTELIIIKTDNGKKIKSLLDHGRAKYEVVYQEKISPSAEKVSKFSFPPPAEFEKVCKRIERPGYRRVNIGLLPDASDLDQTKYNLCLSISRYRRENNLSEPELAQKLKINQAQVEYILFRHLDKLKLDELKNYTHDLKLPSYGRQKTSAKAY